MSTTAKPTPSQLLVDINCRLRKAFDNDEAKILDWLRTTQPELMDLAPVELVALGKSETLLAHIIKCFPSQEPS
jgi:hypothetical protein